MKASSLIQGVRAIKRVRLPLVNAGHLLGGQSPDLASGQQGTGVLPSKLPEVGIRAMTGWEWGEVLRQAATFATDRGGKAEDSDEIYLLGKAAYKLLVACVDPDDAEHAPFFDGGIKQILDSTDLGRDGIAYLAEWVDAWQDEAHPQLLQIDAAEFDGAVAELAGDEDSALRFFLGLRLGTRFRCMRFLAAALQTSLRFNSSIGGGSADMSEKQGSLPKPPGSDD